jgi:hypothetical protein
LPWWLELQQRSTGPRRWPDTAGAQEGARRPWPRWSSVYGRSVDLRLRGPWVYAECWSQPGQVYVEAPSKGWRGSRRGDSGGTWRWARSIRVSPWTLVALAWRHLGCTTTRCGGSGAGGGGGYAAGLRGASSIGGGSTRRLGQGLPRQVLGTGPRQGILRASFRSQWAPARTAAGPAGGSPLTMGPSQNCSRSSWWLPTHNGPQPELQQVQLVAPHSQWAPARAAAGPAGGCPCRGSTPLRRPLQGRASN